MRELGVRLPPKGTAVKGLNTAGVCMPGGARASSWAPMDILFSTENSARMVPVVVRIIATAHSKEARIVPRRFRIPNCASWGLKMKMHYVVRKAVFFLAWSLLIVPFTSNAQNQVLGEVQLAGKTKADKTSGVWVDGQYVGYVDELKGDNKILLLPGEHDIAVRQSGYKDFREKVIVEPHKKTILEVVMLKNPRTRFPNITSCIKLKGSPERAAG